MSIHITPANHKQEKEFVIEQIENLERGGFLNIAVTDDAEGPSIFVLALDGNRFAAREDHNNGSNHCWIVKNAAEEVYNWVIEYGDSIADDEASTKEEAEFRDDCEFCEFCEDIPVPGW